MSRKLTILQVNTLDKIGGAAKIAYNLFQKYDEHNHQSYFATGQKLSTDKKIFQIPQNAVQTIPQWFGMRDNLR